MFGYVFIRKVAHKLDAYGGGGKDDFPSKKVLKYAQIGTTPLLKRNEYNCLGKVFFFVKYHFGFRVSHLKHHEVYSSFIRN